MEDNRNKVSLFVDRYKAHGDKHKAAMESGFSVDDIDELTSTPSVKLAMDKADVGRVTTVETVSYNGILTKTEQEQILSRIVRDENEQTTSKLRAIELLCKAQGSFIDRKEMRISGTIANVSTEMLQQMLEDSVTRQETKMIDVTPIVPLAEKKGVMDW